MKQKVFIETAVRIIALFSTGFFMSFLTPMMHSFFGDVKLEYPERNGIDVWYEWSAAHYWFHWCMVSLFALSVINFILWCISTANKKYE